MDLPRTGTHLTGQVVMISRKASRRLSIDMSYSVQVITEDSRRLTEDPDNDIRRRSTEYLCTPYNSDCGSDSEKMGMKNKTKIDYLAMVYSLIVLRCVYGAQSVLRGASRRYQSGLIYVLWPCLSSDDDIGTNILAFSIEYINQQYVLASAYLLICTLFLYGVSVCIFSCTTVTDMHIPWSMYSVMQPSQ